MNHPISFFAFDNAARPPSGTPAGRIIFSSQNISLSEIAGGALLRLNYTINLHPGLRISIRSITGELSLVGIRSPIPLPLGIAVDPQCHVIDTDYKFPSAERQQSINGCLQLPLSLATLETAERFRDGNPPEFVVFFHGSVFALALTEIDPGVLTAADPLT
jgi:hypothetical protein